MAIIENTPYDELVVGAEAMLSRILTEDDIALFAAMSGDLNPAHMDEAFAKASIFHDVIGHGMWSGALISTVLGMQLPGPGTIYLGQTLDFTHPVRIGDEITVTVRLREKGARRKAVLDCECRNQHGKTVLRGTATVIAPAEKIVHNSVERPRAVIHERGLRLKPLIARAKAGPPLRTGVVHPVDALSLGGALRSAREGVLSPVLIGPREKILATAEELGAALDAFEIIDSPHSHAAAAKGVEMAAAGRVDALMKGALHTDELMTAVIARAGGLRTERRVSHIYVMDTPAYEKLLLISDAAVNIAPDLDEKRDIIQNAIDLAHAFDIETPKVAILSAVETVYPKLQSTVDAATLCKMADRGQIVGGLLDGPLAFDNAVSPAAAAAKGIASPVAGHADILIAPSLEAGNMIAKQLDYLAGAVAAGIVLGARVPVILTSRAEGELPRLASSAIAALYHRKHGILTGDQKT